MSWRRVLPVAGLVALGCREKPTIVGERVELTTTVVDQVCAGTVAQLDAEVERIEAALELGPTEERARIHVVSADDIRNYCEPGATACVDQDPRRLYISTKIYESNIRYELVRDRLAKTTVGPSKPVFHEGIAASLSYPSCSPREDWAPPALAGILSASTRNSLGKEGRYLGGELVAWLLETRGPAALFELMRAVDRNDSADAVRIAYMQTIGGSIDAELYKHWRPDEPVDADRVGCNAPEVEHAELGSRLRFAAELDCGSPRVRNDFDDPSRVFVEWSWRVEEDRPWTLVDSLPEGVSLTVERCDCIGEDWSALTWDGGPLTWLDGDLIWPSPGLYRVRATGPIGASIDVELQGPCDFEAQDCPEGQQCTIVGTCEEAADDPAQLGESCWPPYGSDEFPLPCDVGLTCVGPASGEGVCVPACLDDYGPDCEAGLTCFNNLGCLHPCDPFAATCEADATCLPDLGTTEGACIPNSAQLGLLETCSMFDFACASGLTCETLPDVDGCHDPNPDSWFDFAGCCVPVCDPAAPDPGCPTELPSCVVGEDAVLGTCQP